jgi:hypothetical protein
MKMNIRMEEAASYMQSCFRKYLSRRDKREAQERRENAASKI